MTVPGTPPGATPAGPGLSLVSIITIFLDAAPFFDEAVESVLAQTHERWELLLVDDGSTDGSDAIARRWAASHPERIRYLSHPGRENRGMSASRNLGLEHARGEYVAFLDADDVYLPEKLERQLEVLGRHPEAGMVFGPSHLWYGWTGDPLDVAKEQPRRLGVPPDTLVEPPTLVRRYLDRSADTPATCSVLVRRSTVDAVDGFVSTFHDLYEDQAFFYKVALRFPIFAEGRAWDRYRRHPGSVVEVRIREGTHADDYRPVPSRRAFLAWLDGYFREEGIDDPGLRRLLDHELFPYRHPRRHAAAERLRALARSRPLWPVRRAVRLVLPRRG
jgi:glycosyltransferase involved in cell wall biosynthesis